MKKLTALTLCLALMMTFCLPARAVDLNALTLDGKPATLRQIADACGYQSFYQKDFVAPNGGYQCIWYDLAVKMWEVGLFLGSDGSFDLDQPLTRAQGVVMIVRMLGKEAEAKASTGPITFTDVPDWARPYVSYAVKNGMVKGYSDTAFGSGDAMTAAQFNTLLLRAMGYEDNIDFTWDKATDKALALKLFGHCEYAQYTRTNLFLREDAMSIAYNAVFFEPCKSGQLLKDTITFPGKPSGPVPTATRTQAGDPSVTVVDTSKMEVVTGDNHFQIHSLPGGNYNAVATYYLFVGDYSGPMDFKASVSPSKFNNSVSGTFEAEAGTYRKLVFSFNITPGSYGIFTNNTIKIQVGDFVYTDTVSVNGTLHSMKWS